MPDTDRPSGAPLSQSEADRLSERFTASWDVPDNAADPRVAEQSAAAPGPTPLPAPPPNKSKNHTLLGIAPIVAVGASKPPSVAAPPATPPLALAPAAVRAVTAVPDLTPTLPMAPVSLKSAGSSSPVAAPAPAPSSPESSSVARGLTTPAKP